MNCERLHTSKHGHKRFIRRCHARQNRLEHELIRWQQVQQEGRLVAGAFCKPYHPRFLLGFEVCDVLLKCLLVGRVGLVLVTQIKPDQRYTTYVLLGDLIKC